MELELRAAQREVEMLRKHIKWLEAHYEKLTGHLLKILTLNKIAVP